MPPAIRRRDRPCARAVGCHGAPADDHPYQVAGAERVRAAVERLSWLDSGRQGLPYVRGRLRARILCCLRRWGRVARSTWRPARRKRGGDLSSEQPLLIVGFDGARLLSAPGGGAPGRSRGAARAPSAAHQLDHASAATPTPCSWLPSWTSPNTSSSWARRSRLRCARRTHRPAGHPGPQRPRPTSWRRCQREAGRAGL